MSVISTSLKSLGAFLQDHQVSFSNGLLILFTIGSEQIFSSSVFQCPCTQPEAYNYAILFLLVPALTLGIVGVGVSNLTWRVVHGCRHRSKETANGFYKTSGYLCMALARAAVVPCAWLFVALLDGNYYACMLATKPPCKEDSAYSGGMQESEYNSSAYNESEIIRLKAETEIIRLKVESQIIHLKAESQTIAWISIGFLIVLAFIVICCVRCCDSVTYVQYKYLNSYREAEQEQLDKIIQESSMKMAESNVKVFTQQQLNKEDWDDISRVPDLTIPMTKIEAQGGHLKNPPSSIVDLENASPCKVFLTPLHEWADQRKTQPPA